MMGRFITADSIVSDVYDPQDLNRYAYCRNNPMIYVDPDGHAADTVWDLVNIGMGIASFAYNVKTGNVSGAIVDAVGIVGDSAAAVVPFLPGGVATGIKAYRAADTAADALKAARKGGEAVEQKAKAGSKVTVAGGNAAAHGTEAFRQGTFADKAADWEGNFIKGKQWAADNPLTTKGYAQKYGLPKENTGKPDWVVKGHITEKYTTRPAPASHNNPVNKGGGIEIKLDEPNKVKLDWFHMPD